ncbi:MAG TPA: TIGR03560 family F420-dependent LLM class oxidoreductase [Candidatus Limnocylindrales bacterium]|nr:TIGR03560 family F420-dependent LLM class oxidoreductase [Candidatus Limnocylindrales bacterium]
MPVWFGYHIPTFTFPGVPPEGLFDQVATLAKAAEDAGFAQVTVMDHLYQIRGIGPETEPMLEAYLALAALSQRTDRVRLGAQVTGVTYRNPALLAKEVTTLDTLSKGRAMLGIGAAWNEDEHRGYGYEFPRVGERMDRLDEALAIIRAMFREQRPSFDGRHYRIERALNVPRPLQPNGPRIMVGGGGEQRTLRIAAKHADITHWFGSLGLEALNHKTGLLTRYCEEIGRDPGEIERALNAPVMVARDEAAADRMLARIPPERRGSRPVPIDQAAEQLRPFIDAGFTGFTFNNTYLATPEEIGVAGELLRAVS